jgi:ABC-type multidrug transport system fused ATPase/permease subunit
MPVSTSVGAPTPTAAAPARWSTSASPPDSARAFSDTLSGVVGNLVTLVLTLVVMIWISWQITLLALLLLPVFVLPARRMGTRLARLERESANHNAVMSTQMTERFSAPGATLVKLFGRPARESAEFAARARRVRDTGVRTAMVQSVFVTALTLVSALALAVVYGLGGFYALRGQLEPGAVVTLALLLTRLYAPLTALASARVEVMSALVSFERVFEVLDLTPLIQGQARRWASAGRAGAGGVRPCALRLSGVDVRDLSAESIRETLRMVTQDGHLFHESVRANLLLARPEASEDELWEVLRRARLADLVAALPDRLDTVVGERGYRLSGGERQRLTSAAAAGAPAGGDSGRGHRAPGLDVGGGGAGSAGRSTGRADRGGDRAPALDGPGG